MRLHLHRSVLRFFISLSTLLGLVNVTAAQSDNLAITHVTVINPGFSQTQSNMTILIRGDEIILVGNSQVISVPRSATVIDGTGEFVIPGLWDMHTHFRDAKRDLKMDLANGVLGIRNMGGAAKEVFPLRDAIAAGQQLGPKIVASGSIVDGPNSWSNPKFTVSVGTAEEARSAVIALKKEGANFIKVYDGLSPTAYYAIADETKKLGFYFAGHRPSAISVKEASNAGQRSIEHGVVLSGGSSTEEEDIKQAVDQSTFEEALRTKNFSLIPAKIAKDGNEMLDHFSQGLANQTYRLLANNKTFLTPTLVTEHALTFIDDLKANPDPRMVYVAAEELQWWKPENGMLTKYRTPEYISFRKREYAKMLEEIPHAQALGVRFLAGTDITIPYTYPGFSLHDELELFVEAGLTPMQALETATTNPAELLGLKGRWGQVAPGFTANLVLLKADPLVNISNTRKIEAVVVSGKLLDRPKLDRLLASAVVSGTGSVSKKPSH
jgi:imidazolonepropionase-like amidohydrolase